MTFLLRRIVEVTGADLNSLRPPLANSSAVAPASSPSFFFVVTCAVRTTLPVEALSRTPSWLPPSSVPVHFLVPFSFSSGKSTVSTCSIWHLIHLIVRSGDLGVVQTRSHDENVAAKIPRTFRELVRKWRSPTTNSASSAAGSTSVDSNQHKCHPAATQCLRHASSITSSTTSSPAAAATIECSHFNRTEKRRTTSRTTAQEALVPRSWSDEHCRQESAAAAGWFFCPAAAKFSSSTKSWLVQQHGEHRSWGFFFWSKSKEITPSFHPLGR